MGNAYELWSIRFAVVYVAYFALTNTTCCRGVEGNILSSPTPVMVAPTTTPPPELFPICLMRSSAVGCEKCMEAVNQIQTFLGNEKNQEIIILSLDAWCDSLGGSVAPSCRATIEYYVPQLIDEVVNMDKKETCRRLGFCSVV
jgi:hypothetical protein